MAPFFVAWGFVPLSDLNEAISLIEAEDFDAAREIIVEILYKEYNNLEAWLLLTHCAVDRQEYARAVREALRINPDHVEARRLAVELARETSQENAPSQRRAAGNHMLRSLLNLLMVMTVVGAGALGAYLVLQPDDSPVIQTAPTADPLVACAISVQSALDRLAARCGFLNTGEACLGNVPIEVGWRGDAQRFALAGDRVPVEAIQFINTTSFNMDTMGWGALILQLPERLMVVTAGVRLSEFDTNLDSFVFSSNPVVSACPTVPPSGVLIDTEQSTQFTINGALVNMVGTVFFQVDAAAGLKAVVLRGSVNFSDIGRTVEAGQWVSWAVDPTLRVRELPSEPMTTVNSVRGNIMALTNLGIGLELPVNQWWLPGFAAPEMIFEPSTPTPTRHVTLTPLPTVTVTLNPHSPTPSQTSTASPTPSPTETGIPTPTFLPFDNEPTPTREIPSATLAALEPLTGVWRCAALVGNLSFSYLVIIEAPTAADTILATGLLPDYGDTLVELTGVWLTDPSRLDQDWARIPVVGQPQGWLLLREDRLIKDDDGYAAGGTLRLILGDNGIMEGALFDGNNLIGFLNGCRN
ncbi:MAG: hypothetical protein H6673_01675 [Anaerolineales bacterium]|nr:hypothetical protein [Anaerolineales bacterium]